MQSSRFRRVVTAAVLAVTCMVGSAMAASDYYLKLDGIKGESRVEPDAFEVEGFDFEMTASPSKRKGGGMGTGKVNVQDISLVKRIDKASPLLMKACAQGQHIKEAKLTCRSSTGKEPNPYYTITLEEVLISSYQVGGSGGSGGGSGGGVLPDTTPMESLSLNFTKITFEYFFIGEGGQVESIVFTYDLKMNKKV